MVQIKSKIIFDFKIDAKNWCNILAKYELDQIYIIILALVWLNLTRVTLIP